MPDANQVTVAKAVVTALNGAPGGTFSQSCTAARAYRKRVKREEIDGVLMTVIGNGRTFVNAARRISERDVIVAVVLQKATDPATVADVDAMQLLVQEVADFLEFEPQGDAGFLQLENEPIFDPDLLENNQLFESSILVTYRVQREDDD